MLICLVYASFFLFYFLFILAIATAAIAIATRECKTPRRQRLCSSIRRRDSSSNDGSALTRVARRTRRVDVGVERLELLER